MKAFKKSGLCKVFLQITALALVVGYGSGCASSPDKMETAYVSPLKYKNYDCDQIIMEMDYVGKRTAQLYNSLEKQANADAWQMGVGLVLFWPTLFLLEGGDGPEAAEYSRLKGEYEALTQAAIEKKCDSAMFPPSPEELIQVKQAELEKKSKEFDSRR
jgi:hypothetical protein